MNEAGKKAFTALRDIGPCKWSPLVLLDCDTFPVNRITAITSAMPCYHSQSAMLLESHWVGPFCGAFLYDNCCILA